MDDLKLKKGNDLQAAIRKYEERVKSLESDELVVLIRSKYNSPSIDVTKYALPDNLKSIVMTGLQTKLERMKKEYEEL